MATFYVLSSRHVLGQRFGEMLSALFPGERTTSWDWRELAELLAALVEERTGAFIVYREDLDDKRTVKDALQDHFGATADDQIVMVDAGVGVPAFAEKLPKAA
jgi:hypothetical protein